jgi:hypothetical protein
LRPLPVRSGLGAPVGCQSQPRTRTAPAPSTEEARAAPFTNTVLASLSTYVQCTRRGINDNDRRRHRAHCAPSYYDLSGSTGIRVGLVQNASLSLSLSFTLTMSTWAHDEPRPLWHWRDHRSHWRLGSLSCPLRSIDACEFGGSRLSYISAAAMPGWPSAATRGVTFGCEAIP